jgi:serine protease Do
MAIKQEDTTTDLKPKNAGSSSDLSATAKTPIKSKSNKPSTSTPKTLLLVLIAVTAGFFGGWLGGAGRVSNSDTTITREIVEGESNLINTIAKDVSPSVVSINVTTVTTTEDFFGFGRDLESRSAGTGFIISKEGIVLTNRHVVSSSDSEVTVVLYDGSELPAEVIGRTNENDPLDIAFLKITDTQGKELVPANLGNSEAMEVGDRVVAIGNALGEFQNTVTSGIISGYGRDIQASGGNGVETLQNLFQTDAAINSGNSGGPLVNSASEVIGVNVATASADNISFAIPINDVKGLIETVLATGKLERPYLGVRYVMLNEEVAGQINIAQTEGAYIPRGTSQNPSIMPGSPAEKAGLEPGDVIIEINGQKLNEDTTLVTVLGSKRVGESVEVKVIRDGEEQTLNVTLEAVPEE